MKRIARLFAARWLAVALVLGLAGLVYAGAPAAAPRAPAASRPAPAPAPPPAADQLRRAGGWLVDRGGRVVVLHGVNAVWKQAPYAPPDSLEGFTAADADWLAAHGFNAVRLGVLFAGVMPQRHLIDAAYLDRVDRVVRLLGQRGIYVLLDFHQDLYGERYQGEGFPRWSAQPRWHDAVFRAGFPLNYLMPPVSGAFDRFWDNRDGLQDDYRDAWVAVAARWHDADHLMGYDLINEPWRGSPWLFCAAPGGCRGFEAGKLQAMYQRVLSGIRGADRGNIVWFEPQVLFDFGAASHLGERAVDDAQLGFSWHNYCLSATLAQVRGGGCAQLEARVYANARSASARLGAASLLTEFGASDDAVDIARVARYADQNLLGWMYWSYKNWADPTTQAQGSGAQSLFVRDADLASAKRPKLEVLERPYPQAVAGTPLAYDYDAAARRFSLKYSTILPSGTAAPAALLTQIFVPPLHYPRGYAVAVQGGHVVSAANAPKLLVAADPGSRAVAVAVTPAASAELALSSAAGADRPVRAGP